VATSFVWFLAKTARQDQRERRVQLFFICEILCLTLPVSLYSSGGACLCETQITGCAYTTICPLSAACARYAACMEAEEAGCGGPFRKEERRRGEEEGPPGSSGPPGPLLLKDFILLAVCLVLWGGSSPSVLPLPLHQHACHMLVLLLFCWLRWRLPI